MSAPRRYHTLLSQAAPGEPWAIEFGDYSRATVESERSDYRDHEWKAAQLKIITTGESQAEITAAVDALNQKSKP